MATYGRLTSDKQQQVGETGLTAKTAAASSCTAQQLPSRRPRHHSGPKAAEVTYSKLIAGHLQMATNGDGDSATTNSISTARKRARNSPPSTPTNKTVSKLRHCDQNRSPLFDFQLCRAERVLSCVNPTFWFPLSDRGKFKNP